MTPHEGLGGAAEFFADDAAESLLEGFGSVLDVAAQDFVDEGLVVAAAGSFDLAAKPIQGVRIQANRDASFAAGSGDYCSSLGAAKVIFTFHFVPHIVRVRVALLFWQKSNGRCCRARYRPQRAPVPRRPNPRLSNALPSRRSEERRVGKEC